MSINVYSEITPEILDLAKQCYDVSQIEQELYTKYEVKRGLRDLNGKGVLAGLTDISEVRSSLRLTEKAFPAKESFFYRGYDIEELVQGFLNDQRYGFEEITYLLLTGNLPTCEQLESFSRLLAAIVPFPPVLSGTSL